MIEEKYLYRVTTPDRKSCYVVAEHQYQAAYNGNIKLGQMWDMEQLTVEFIDMVVTGLIDDDKEDEK